MLDAAYLATLAVVFGGMVTFQLLFAPVVFTQLEMPVARGFIRRFFPFYYLFFAIATALGMLLAWFTGDRFAALALVLCAAAFLISRQVLMPRANDATDRGDTAAFKRLHTATVVINTVQLGALAWLLWRLA